jgi:small subunit ribosomal protein S4
VARYLGPKAKLSRREGTDLFLKSARRAIGDKAKFDPSPASTAAPPARAPSDFGLQLREKQKVKRMYGVLERQFRRYFAEAERRRATPARTCCPARIAPGQRRLPHGLRLDARRARQLVSHKAHHGQRRVVNIASYLVKAGDVVAVREKSKKQLRVTDALKLAESIGLPAWVRSTATKLEGTFKKVPDRDEFGADINESLIVELYSR